MPLIQELNNCLKNHIPSQFGLGLVGVNEIEGFDLHPAERSCLSSRATPKRKTDFKLGRMACQVAMKAKGMPPQCILKGRMRQPLWPDGIVGSITHKRGIGIALVAEKSIFRGVGIDLERTDQPLNPEHFKKALYPAEMDWCLRILRLQEQRLCRMFSAKEALYKMLSPIIGGYVNYRDVILRWDPEKKAFISSLKRNLGAVFTEGTQFEIFSIRTQGFIFSLVYLQG